MGEVGNAADAALLFNFTGLRDVSIAPHAALLFNRTLLYDVSRNVEVFIRCSRVMTLSFHVLARYIYIYIYSV